MRPPQWRMSYSGQTFAQFTSIGLSPALTPYFPPLFSPSPSLLSSQLYLFIISCLYFLLSVTTPITTINHQEPPNMLRFLLILVAWLLLGLATAQDPTFTVEINSGQIQAPTPVHASSFAWAVTDVSTLAWIAIDSPLPKATLSTLTDINGKRHESENLLLTDET